VQCRGPDLIGSGGRIEIVQGLDAATHEAVLLTKS